MERVAIRRRLEGDYCLGDKDCRQRIQGLRGRGEGNGLFGVGIWIISVNKSDGFSR